MSALRRAIGPGIVAGASDVDPTTVGAVSFIGSTTGYALSWLFVLLLPILIALQVISARLGVVTRKGLGTLMRERFGLFWSSTAVGLVVAVNVITIAADLEGGAAALALLLGATWQWYVAPLALFFAVLVALGGYDELRRYLRFLLFVFLAYVGAALLARPDWHALLQRTVAPTFQFQPVYVAGALALLGTSLSAYVYLWETIEAQEEGRPHRGLSLVELDAAIGMVFTGVITWFIMVSTGATLYRHTAALETAEQAATALQPLAGPYAALLFAIGLLASALLAIPILAATTAYATAQNAGWPGSLRDPPRRENAAFYAVAVGSLVAGATLTAAGVEPVKLLLLASIAGALGTPLLLVLMLRLGGDPAIMGENTIPPLAKYIGWAAVALVTAVAVAFLIVLFGL